MRTFLAVLIGSLVLAFLSIGLSYIGYVELLWVAVVALFVSDHEDEALGIAVLSGFLFDVMMHGNVGFTSLSILAGLAVYIAAKGFGFADRAWQKVVVVVLVFVTAFLVEFGLRSIVDPVGFDIVMVRVIAVSVGVNAVLTGIGVFVVREIDRRISTSGTVKIV